MRQRWHIIVKYISVGILGVTGISYFGYGLNLFDWIAIKTMPIIAGLVMLLMAYLMFPGKQYFK